MHTIHNNITAYILQNLGVKPTIKKSDIFSSDDPAYTGPELPSRYDGIILPADWYIPGKGKRKKRQHRASHGKISFTDLSKSISSAWRNIDDETKLFCAKLSDAGNQEYKKKLMERRRISDASASDETKAAAIKYARSTMRKRKSVDATPANSESTAVVSSTSNKKKKQKKIVTDVDTFISQSTSSSLPSGTSTSFYDILPPHGNGSNTSTNHLGGAPFNWSPDFIFSGFPTALPSTATIRSVSHVSVPPSSSMAAPPSSYHGGMSSDKSEHSDVDLSDDDILGMYMRS